MNNTELTDSERFWEMPYRDPRLNLGAGLLALSFFTLGLFSSSNVGAPASLGLLAAFIILCLNEAALKQHHLVDLQAGEFLRVTTFLNRTWVKKLERFENIELVTVNPRMNYWSRHQRWTNPISIWTNRGTEIVIRNKNGLHDFDYALGCAEILADILECELYHGREEMALEMVAKGDDLVLRVKDTDTGLLGKAVALSAIVGLVWGLIALVPC